MEWLLLGITIILQATVVIVHCSAATTPTTKRVGVILSQGFELLDAMGPYEALKEVQEHYYSSVDIEHRRW
jgi:hypothetical protein